MNKKRTLNQLTKRNFIIFSASFFAILFLFLGTSSCKKQEYSNGKDLLNSQYGINSVLVDTFALKTYTIKEDSIICKNKANTLLGTYNDPTFGKLNSSIYTNLLLENPGTTNFTSSQTIDSVVFSMQYSGYYGNPESISIEVYELADLMNTTDSIYQFSTYGKYTENLVDPAFSNYTPKPTTKSVVGTDTLNAQLRIRLKSSFGQHLISGVAQGHYASQEAFKEFFKGLYIKVTDYNPAKGKGAVYYFAMTAVNSGLTIYYKDQDQVAKSFRYLINNKGVFFNHIEKNTSGTKVEEVLNNPNNGDAEFYAQAYGLRAVIEIPGISAIPQNAIVHSAVIELPFTAYYLDKLYPSAAVSVGFFEDNDFHKPKTISTGNLYNEATKSYSLNINNYSSNRIALQQIVNGTINTKTFFVIPNNFSNSSERIIFNGKNTNYKLKPKLTVIYTLK